MGIYIDKSAFRKKSVDTDLLLNQISTGKAILFTGAGFSKGTQNIDGNEPPVAKKLAKEICQLGGFDEDEDLRYAAEYYLSTCTDTDNLVSFLKKQYSVSSVSEEHVNICKANWRRFYTTNYDKSIEMASLKSDKLIECIDIDFPTTEYYKREDLCIHLNGSIDSLTSSSLESSFKLSASSYISADSFITSDWFYYFKKDLERSSAIVFVGYSMYDIEIQRILFEDDAFKEKVYFITSDNPDPKSVFTLSKFGYVFPIGVSGFSKLINDNIKMFQNNDDEHNYESLCLYELSNESKEIRDSHVEIFLYYGNLDDTYIDNGVSGKQRIPYLIIRDELQKVLEFTKSGKNTIVYSDLGNGKSILLRELKTCFTINSINVFEIKDWDGDYIGDFDALVRSGNKAVIIIDGYEPYIDLIMHYSATLPKHINIVASARTAEHERLRPELNVMGFNFNELNIDSLSSDDASTFVDVIDNIGMWGNQAGLSRERKINILTKKNSLQISLSLLSLFESPQIKDRISILLSTLFKNPSYKETIFAIALIEILDLTANFSLISEVANNNEIYTSSLRNNESFNHLFKLANKHALTKSSLFCLFLIRNDFPASYIP